MRMSVVINTCDRETSLRATLRSLTFQTLTDFEVIVVNGPSKDQTELLLKEYDGRIKIRQCPVRNLSVSRNVGIDAASGEVVVFIDDDALATPSWLQDLAEAYADPSLGGVGGKVYDHTGLNVQDHIVVCHRLGGRAEKDVPTPLKQYLRPGADPFLHLLGTNASFRRQALVAVDGFDEEYDYFLDETDLCARLIDQGFPLAVHPRAVVHHKFLASHLRSRERVLFDPYSVAKNIVYFTLQQSKEGNVFNVEDGLQTYLADRHQEWSNAKWNGSMNTEQARFFDQRFAEGVAIGRERARHARKTRPITPTADQAFLPFPVVRPAGRKLTLCFASREYPPHSYGGIGRFTFDLATTFAARGHEVHVITSSSAGTSYLDLEQDVWVHRLEEPTIPPLDNHPLGPTLALSLRNFHEANRIHAENPIDIFQAPIWMVESALIACQRRFPTLITLMTTHMRIREMDPEFGGDAYLEAMIPFERRALLLHTHAHAISSAILDTVRCDYGLPAHSFVAPLCVRDMAEAQHASNSSHSQIRILFVGRIEKRKGPDILLSAARHVLRDFPNSEITIIGKNAWGTGQDPVQAFRCRHADDPDLLNRVHFLNEVNENNLQAHYAACDLLCVPSRYESFGLVLLEAMVHAKACVATDIGGIREIVIHEETGLLFPLEDEQALIKHLTNLIRDHAFRTRLGQAGRKRYEKLFSPQTVADRLEKEYLSIIQNFDFNAQDSTCDYISRMEHLFAGTGISPEMVRHLTETSSFQTLSGSTVEGLAWRILRHCKRMMSRIAPEITERVSLRIKPLLNQILSLPSSMALWSDWAQTQLMRGIPATKANIRALHDHLTFISTRHSAQIESRVNEISSQMHVLTTSFEQLQSVKARIEEIAALNARSRDEILFELMRRAYPDRLDDQEPTLWEIRDPIRFEQALVRGELRLNLGCGHLPLDGYFNVDLRSLEGVDIVANVTNLQLKPGTVREIRCAHLLEHFPRQNLLRDVLPHWRSLLAPEGRLRIIVPDAEAMLAAHAQGDISFEELRLVTFGLQDYNEDFHYTMFAREDLATCLISAGFASTHWLATGRRNGLCLEMEIEACPEA